MQLVTLTEAALRYGITRSLWRYYVRTRRVDPPKMTRGKRVYYSLSGAAEAAVVILGQSCPSSMTTPIKLAKLLRVPRHYVVNAAHKLGVGVKPNKRRLHLDRAAVAAIKTHLGVS